MEFLLGNDWLSSSDNGLDSVFYVFIRFDPTGSYCLNANVNLQLFWGQNETTGLISLPRDFCIVKSAFQI